MATDAIITLDRLRCIRESDGTGHSEPYIWPVLVTINTTNGNVLTGSPAQGDARLVIDNDMRAGQTVIIPAGVRTLRVRLDEPQHATLLLSVVLWEHDETPTQALTAGYNAYVRELRAAITANLLALQAAQGNPNEENAIRAAIEKRVNDAVKAALEQNLTTSEKARILLGTLNLDDVVGSDSANLGTPVPNTTKSFSLNFSNESGSEVYAIDGNLAVKPVPVDRCQAQADAVRAAQAEVDGIRHEIRGLQDEMSGTTGSTKATLARLIKEQREHLKGAIRNLERAQKALEVCRSQQTNQPGIPITGGVVRQ